MVSYRHGRSRRWRHLDFGDFMQRRFTERSVKANTKKSTVFMAMANHETPFNVGIDAAFSETSLHKVPIDQGEGGW